MEQVLLMDVWSWLETTPVATFVRESTYGFVLVVAIHLLGLTVSVGLLMWFDLRLLGVAMTSLRVSDVYRRIAPYMAAGFVCMFASGAALFTSYATSAVGNTAFRVKLCVMLAAAANAALFHLRTERGIAAWDDAPRPPLPARLAGLCSILLWGVVIVAGRVMSYTMF